jgi:zinc transport system permease protein
MAVVGVGAAFFLRAMFPRAFGALQPIHGATLAALGGAVIIGLIHQRVAERMDTLIGALWSIGMAVGILLVKFTPGYNTELMSYLFGNIVFVSWADVRLMLVLDALILGTVLVFHKRFLALCLDEEQAQLQGIHLLGTNVALLCVVALTVIVLTQVVGLILVIALLSLPAATAAHHVSRMAPLIAVSTAICALLTTVPRIAVYGTHITPEAAIVLAAAGAYLLSVLVTRFRGRK